MRKNPNRSVFSVREVETAEFGMVSVFRISEPLRGQNVEVIVSLAEDIDALQGILSRAGVADRAKCEAAEKNARLAAGYGYGGAALLRQQAYDRAAQRIVGDPSGNVIGATMVPIPTLYSASEVILDAAGLLGGTTPEPMQGGGGTFDGGGASGDY